LIRCWVCMVRLTCIQSWLS